MLYAALGLAAAVKGTSGKGCDRNPSARAKTWFTSLRILPVEYLFIFFHLWSTFFSAAEPKVVWHACMSQVDTHPGTNQIQPDHLQQVVVSHTFKPYSGNTRKHHTWTYGRR